MNTKTLLTISALALGLYPASLPTHADSPMVGMDMGGMKMAPKPTVQKPSTAPLTVTATVNPAAPQAGDNTLALTVLGSDGKPATGLKLTASVAMTSMDMGTTHPAFVETGGGHYAAKVSFSMNGPWRVVVRSGATKVAVLNFEAGAKTPWKSPPIKGAGVAPGKTDAPAASSMAGLDMGADKKAGSGAGSGGSMAGMDMSSQATKPIAALPGANAPQTEAAKPADRSVSSNQSAGNGGASSMEGMDMKGTETPGAKMDGMKSDGMKMEGMTGIADMKTATVPELHETGTYTATGDENWDKQAGFGHNAGMVGMMNQMMVGGSGMEGMKMPAMDMKFDAKNYAKPSADDADDMAGMDMGGGKSGGNPTAQGSSMPGMDMGGKGAMKGMDMGQTAKPGAQAPSSQGGGMAGMDMGQGGMKNTDMSASKPQPASPGPAGALKITAAMPSSAKAGDNALTIAVADSDGKPVSGAKITASVAMTSMDMGTTHPVITEKGPGQYAATANFSMAGPWRVRVKVTAPGRAPQIKSFDFSAK